MTIDNLEVISETNAASAPRKNVGAIACEKISDNRTTSGMKSFILSSTYRPSTCIVGAPLRDAFAHAGR